MSNTFKLIQFMHEVDDAIATHYRTKPNRFSYTIAGGALRDCLLGQPVKDIDVVVERQEDWDVSWPGGEYGPTGGFSAADAGFSVCGLPVQLIYRNEDISPAGMNKYHSMGVSNIFWQDGVLSFGETFFRDVRDQKHTVNRERWGGVGNDPDEDLLQKYIDKITAKYPWPLRT